MQSLADDGDDDQGHRAADEGGDELGPGEGGGQPTDGTKVQRAQTRTTGLYAADGDMAIKKSNENPLMDVFYNSPMAAKAHDLLHNHH